VYLTNIAPHIQTNVTATVELEPHISTTYIKIYTNTHHWMHQEFLRRTKVLLSLTLTKNVEQSN